jgi:lysozyme family protein
MNYDEAFARVIGHEGKFQDNYNDRGNWTSGQVGVGERKGTKYGISAMSYPNEDIKNLSLERAKEIYYEDFWKRVRGDLLPTAVAYQLFDAAINHGIGNAIRMLQRALDVADDGQFGPLTRDATFSKPVDDILKLFLAERLIFFTKLSTWDTFGRGWARRVAENMRYAAYDYNAPWYEQLEVER